MIDTLRYAAAVDTLQGRPLAVSRLQTFAGPLPALYPERR
jgi:hypothetical protein